MRVAEVLLANLIIQTVNRHGSLLLGNEVEEIERVNTKLY